LQLLLLLLLLMMNSSSGSSSRIKGQLMMVMPFRRPPLQHLYVTAIKGGGEMNALNTGDWNQGMTPTPPPLLEEPEIYTW
jgi:hypothetical protein